MCTGNHSATLLLVNSFKHKRTGYRYVSFFFLFFFEQDTITNVKDNKKPRPLYDIPYMFEAREFLRKKLIGKKVTTTFYLLEV